MWVHVCECVQYVHACVLVCVYFYMCVHANVFVCSYTGHSMNAKLSRQLFTWNFSQCIDLFPYNVKCRLLLSREIAPSRARAHTHTHTHTHTQTYMFRASRGDHQSVLEFFTYFRGLCYSSGRAITGLSQSEDLRHLSVCREREISHREKKGRNPD